MNHFTRFAPSPTGYLHRGHLFSAIWVWAAAQKCNYPVHLRIEDHDQSRSRPEFIHAIKEDLSWFGFKWERESLQSKKENLYYHYYEILRKQNLLYPCTCSRKMMNGKCYPNTCRNKTVSIAKEKDQPVSYRFKVPENSKISWNDLRLGYFEEYPEKQCGDFLVYDKLCQWTYQFAVSVDDLDEDIALVVRGEDLRDSTARQILLMRYLEKKTPPRYLHHPLLFEPSGEKLSKRFQSASLRGERAAGASQEEILGSVCSHAGLLEKNEPISLKDAFSLIFQGSKSLF